MNALEIRNLSKQYKNFYLDNINLTLPSGYIMGLIGENGAGKTTIIKLILNIISKNSGTIKILGKNNTDHLIDVKEEIGIVLDEPGLPEELDIRQINNIMKYSYKNWNEKAFFEFSKKFNIPTDKRFGKFSKGTKMKTAITIALSHNAKLLILDEATNGLDPVAREDILEILCEFTRSEENSVLISSHIVSDLEKICDYVAFVHNGKLLLCEEKDLLKDNYCIINCSKKEFNKLNKSTVLGKKETAYGINAIVKRSEITDGVSATTVSIEELFVYMVKEER